MVYFNKHNTRSLKLLCSLTVGMLLCVSPVGAQTADQGKNDALYLYRGADRDQRLLEKARQEGSVVVYTSFAALESKKLVKAFENKYGIKVEAWRALSDKVLQRAVTEGQARHHTVDVIETNGPEMEMMAREKLLSKFYSPYFADQPPAAVVPDRLWATERLAVFTVAYNTNKVKREDLPKHIEGFLDPKWKGKLGIEATDSDWMATIIKNMDGNRGTKLFEKLAEQKPDVRKGHSLLTEMVGAGEVQVALTIYNANAESLKRRGGPIEWIPIEPVVARQQGIGLAKHAPHPHAAMLFADFILSPEGQELFNSMGVVPASVKVKSNLNNFPYLLVDTVKILDEQEKWEKLWERLFLKK